MQPGNAPKARPSHLTTADAVNKVCEGLGLQRLQRPSPSEDADPELTHSKCLFTKKSYLKFWLGYISIKVWGLKSKKKSKYLTKDPTDLSFDPSGTAERLLLLVSYRLLVSSTFYIFLAFLDSKGINNQWMGVRVASQGPGKHVMVSKTLWIWLFFLVKKNQQTVIFSSSPCRPALIGTSRSARSLVSLAWCWRVSVTC